MKIDWARLAVPQIDSYDSITLRKMGKEFGVSPHTPHHDFAEDLLPAIELLKRWPEGFKALDLIDEIKPFKMGRGGRGCSSGGYHPRERKGLISITVSTDDTTGCAEGLVHEIAHQRLYLMGVGIEEHDGRLLSHPPKPEHVFFSPIRRDVLRPITALLHGIYAYTFVLKVDLLDEGFGQEYLATNVPRVRMGLATLADNLVPSPAGVHFFNSFYPWALSLMADGERVLREKGTPEIPVPPLGVDVGDYC